MDVAAQVLLNSAILSCGLILLVPILPKANALITISLGWFSGWALVGLSGIGLIMAGASLNLGKLAFASSIVIISVMFFQITTIVKSISQIRVLTQVVLSILAGIGLFYLLAKYGNFAHYSPDSLSYQGISRIFHNYGWVENGESFVFSQVFNSRLPLFVIIHNIAFLAEINVFYVFTSAATIMTSTLIFGSWIRNIGSIKAWTVIWLAFCFGLFFTSKLIMLHSFYLHTNLTNMAFFTAGVLCLEMHKEKNDIFFFLLASCLLGATCLIRKEMLVFSLLPFFILTCFSKPRLGVLLPGFIIYSILAYSWFFWGALGFQSLPEIADSAFKTTGHGGIGIVFVCALACPIVFFLPYLWRFHYYVKSPLFFAFALLFLISIIVFRGHDAASATKNLMLLLFTPRGLWDGTWLIFMAFCATWIAGSMAHYKVARDREKIAELSIPLIICSFFFLRILLFIFFESPADASWNDSGNRILLTIVPLCSYWMGLAGVKLLRKVNSLGIGAHIRGVRVPKR